METVSNACFKEKPEPSKIELYPTITVTAAYKIGNYQKTIHHLPFTPLYQRSQPANYPTSPEGVPIAYAEHSAPTLN